MKSLLFVALATLGLAKGSIAQTILDTLIVPADLNVPFQGHSFEYSSTTPSPGWDVQNGGWTTGNLPFLGYSTGAQPNSTYWPVGSTYYLRTRINLTNYDLSNVNWYIAVDNGYFLYLNGQLVSSANAPGTAIQWEYFGEFDSTNLVQGFNDIALIIIDDGAGAAVFNMMLTAIVSCGQNINTQPISQSLTTNSNGQFVVGSANPNATFQWQSDFGQGFQTLNNYGNYSGVNTNSLSISNVQLSNHAQPIRAISTSGECIDTSDVAYISIIDTCINNINDTTLITVTDTLIINTTITGINPQNNSNTIKVFPNPSNSHITIDYGNFATMNGYQLKIENSLGQQVFQTNISQQSDYLNLDSWGGNGLYFVHIVDPQGNTIDIRKIVLQ